MKKIIFAALAVLMMLGFAGCSGDLHDAGPINIVGYQIKNLDDNGVTYYIMSQSPKDSGNAQPGNAWSTATTIFGTVENKGFSVDCATWAVMDNVQVQVKKEGASGIDWDSGVNITTTNFNAIPSGANCTIVVDCTAKTAELVAK